LNNKQVLAFHHMVAQLLFMATRARRDIQTAVAFLTTRVKKPDKDNWGKLKRVLKYLNGTKYLKLNVGVDNLGMPKWYIDGSHNVHWDCKGHRGVVFMLGKGAMSSYSRKVKLNTRSLTETELYTADMFILEMLWSLHFIQAQGYETECAGLYQDNTSLQLLIKNGSMSIGKKTKHIKVKFFFIKDRVGNGEIKLINCPTEVMWADIMTKLLQGTAFRVMQAELMSCPVNYEDPEPEKRHEKKQSNYACKTVTWKNVVATSFKTPCVEYNRVHRNKPRLDRCLGMTRFPPGSTTSQVGEARLPRTTWQVGVTGGKQVKQ
jgi:hypothetical protein